MRELLGRLRKLFSSRTIWTLIVAGGVKVLIWKGVLPDTALTEASEIGLLILAAYFRWDAKADLQ